MRVKLRNPNWPGLDDHDQRTALRRGSAALIAGDNDRGLRLLRELLARKRDYPDCSINWPRPIAAGYPGASSWASSPRGGDSPRPGSDGAGTPRGRATCATDSWHRAGKRLKEGQAREGFARLDSLVDALRIWPTLSEAERLYKPAFEAVPTLDVAVNNVPAPLGPWVQQSRRHRA